MLDGFITWEMLAVFTTLSAIVYMFVEFTKEIKIVSKIKTKYYSALVAFALITLTQLHGGTFQLWDVVLYVLSAMVISLSANGLHDFNKDIVKNTTVSKQNK